MNRQYEDWEIFEFENTVVELACNIETMDEDEYKEKYNSLPPEYQMQVDANKLAFADNAIGSTSWRSDW